MVTVPGVRVWSWSHAATAWNLACQCGQLVGEGLVVSAAGEEGVEPIECLGINSA